jgi:hypothetical protein
LKSFLRGESDRPSRPKLADMTGKWQLPKSQLARIMPLAYTFYLALIVVARFAGTRGAGF